MNCRQKIKGYLCQTKYGLISKRCCTTSTQLVWRIFHKFSQTVSNDFAFRDNILLERTWEKGVQLNWSWQKCEVKAEGYASGGWHPTRPGSPLAGFNETQNDGVPAPKLVVFGASLTRLRGWRWTMITISPTNQKLQNREMSQVTKTTKEKTMGIID